MTATSAICSRCRTKSPPICPRRIAAGDLSRRGFRAGAASSTDLTAWDRFLQGAVALLPADQGGFRQPRSTCSGRPSRSIPRFRSRTPISPPSMVQGVQFGWIKSTREIVDRGDGACRNQRPARSPLVLCIFDPVLSARDGGPSRGGDGGRETGGRAQPLRHGRARRARHLPFRDRRTPRRRSSCFRWPRSAATATRAINGRR